MVLVLCRISAFGFNGCCFVFLLKFTIVVIGLNHRCFDIHNQLFRLTQSVVSTHTISCYDLHNQLFRHTQSVVTTYTISCFDIHNQLFRHTQSVVSTYTISCFDIRNQLFRLTHSVVSTYTFSCFDLHNQLFWHTQSVVSTYTISCFDIRNQLFRLTHSVVSTYTISCYDLHNQLLRISPWFLTWPDLTCTIVVPAIINVVSLFRVSSWLLRFSLVLRVGDVHCRYYGINQRCFALSNFTSLIFTSILSNNVIICLEFKKEPRLSKLLTSDMPMYACYKPIWRPMWKRVYRYYYILLLHPVSHIESLSFKTIVSLEFMFIAVTAI